MKPVIKKRRKARAPLTEEQKAERRERLAKARANKKPPKYSAIDPAVRDLPDEHQLSLKKVRQWINVNKAERARYHKLAKTDKKAHGMYNQLDTYVQNLESYLRSGVYLDLYYGENQEFKVKFRCVSMAYHDDGTPKRTAGVYYPDIGTYTQEMYNDDNNIKPTKKKKRSRKA
jgi:hypothetical protein